jgi:hypothetical protein
VNDMSIAMRDTTRAPRRALTLALPVLAGLVAGVGSSLALPPRAAPAAAAPAPTEEAAPSPRGAPRSAAHTAQVALPPAVDARLEALERKAAEAAPAPQAPEDHEAQRQRAREAYEAVLDQHTRAPVDPVWAEPTSATLGAAMGTLGASAGGNAVVKGVDCRTDSCVATLEFPSYTAARTSYAAYVSEMYEVNCARQVMLDTPEDPESPFSVQVLFMGCKR